MNLIKLFENCIKKMVNIVKASSSARICYIQEKLRFFIVTAFNRAAVRYSHIAKGLFKGKRIIKPR
jgi:hypothetical protein